MADYELPMFYYPGKANVVVDALSRKIQIGTSMLSSWLLVEEFIKWHSWPVGQSLVCNILVDSELIEQIWAAQRTNNIYDQFSRKAVYGNNPFSIDVYGHIRYEGRIWLPEDVVLKSAVVAELHSS